MNVPIWPGSSSFEAGQTPFGFYDSDTQFVADANKFSKFAAQRLGYPLVEIELQDLNFFTAFEEAITTYGNELYAYQVADNLLTFQGASSSINPANEELVQENLSEIVRLSNQYGTEAGVGGDVTYYKGILPLTSSVQTYDLNAWAASENIEGKIEIKRIYYEASPAITRYFDPYAGTGVGMQQMMDSFGFGSFSPAINFMLMPVNYDLQKIQAIELNDQIRKSQYTFELINNQLKVFPIPGDRVVSLCFQYVKLEEANQPYYDRTGREIITNASNVPYQNPNYTRINSVGRQWIFEYGLAIVKEILGYVRGKYSQIPIPGSEVTLNQSDLISAATAEKGALIERLRTYFDTTSRKTLLEKKAAEGEAQNKTLGQSPMVIYVG
tara:strand:- start:1549 stop:2697 length:1149 start_codon:yes stop_codon:yes gene_type:complete